MATVDSPGAATVPGMKFGSVCSGIEAASVAWEPLGWKAEWLSEIAPFPRAVLEYRYPDVPLHGDFTAIDPATVEPVDVLIGGTPCQAFASRGNRQGLADERGRLTLAFVDLAHGLAARSDRPLRYAIWENVARVLRSRSEIDGRSVSDFGCFLGALVGSDADLDAPGGKWPDAGMASGPAGRVAWRVLDAQYFGVPQQRPRVFVVFAPGETGDPARILFERQECSGDHRSGDEIRQDALAGRSRKGAKYDQGMGEATEIESWELGYYLGWSGFERQVTGVAGTLTAGDDRRESGVMDLMGPRVFTGVERERLMGFPDHWTAIPWRGKQGWEAPLGLRGEATGNSMVVPVVRWIGERIAAAH